MQNDLSSAVMCGRAWGGRVGLTLGKPSKPDRPCPETTGPDAVRLPVPP